MFQFIVIFSWHYSLYNKTILIVIYYFHVIESIPLVIVFPLILSNWYDHFREFVHLKILYTHNLKMVCLSSLPHFCVTWIWPSFYILWSCGYYSFLMIDILDRCLRWRNFLNVHVKIISLLNLCLKWWFLLNFVS